MCSLSRGGEVFTDLFTNASLWLACNLKITIDYDARMQGAISRSRLAEKPGHSLLGTVFFDYLSSHQLFQLNINLDNAPKWVPGSMGANVSNGSQVQMDPGPDGPNGSRAQMRSSSPRKNGSNALQAHFFSIAICCSSVEPEEFSMVHPFQMLQKLGFRKEECLLSWRLSQACLPK
jgi:hypothetical protein